MQRLMHSENAGQWLLFFLGQAYVDLQKRFEEVHLLEFQFCNYQ